MTKGAKASGKRPAEPAQPQSRETGNHWARGHRAAARTTWIIGGVALAFYAATLVLGHFGRLNPSWKPQPTVTQAAAQNSQLPVHTVTVAATSHAAHP